MRTLSNTSSNPFQCKNIPFADAVLAVNFGTVLRGCVKPFPFLSKRFSNEQKFRTRMREKIKKLNDSVSYIFVISLIFITAILC